jgi:ferredoxin
MRANYGYSDGSGEYYLTIDTDLCDGCGDCLAACPQGVLEVAEDDWDDLKARVKPELGRRLADVCWGFQARCSGEAQSCQTACPRHAITHTW